MRRGATSAMSFTSACGKKRSKSALRSRDRTGDLEITEDLQSLALPSELFRADDVLGTRTVYIIQFVEPIVEDQRLPRSSPWSGGIQIG